MGLRQGKGTYVWSDRSYYQGEWDQVIKINYFLIFILF